LVKLGRSAGVVLLVGGWAVALLWLLWLAPIAGAVLGATAYRWIGATKA